MNLLRLLAASVISVSMVGCCCSRCAVSNPCDPCGGVPIQGCSFSRLWASRCNGYSWNNACQCGSCGDVVDSGCGCGSGSANTAMVSTPSSCGCAQPSSANISHDSTYSIPSSPTYSTPGSSSNYVAPSTNGTPSLRTIPESSPNTNVPEPPKDLPDSAMRHSSNTSSKPQMVSYEEFQRLPGTIVSGPGSSSDVVPAPSAIQQTSMTSTPFLAPPPPAAAASNSNIAGKFVNPSLNKKSVWVPTNGY